MSDLMVEFGNIRRCDGAALFKAGDTRVQAGLYGPVEVRVSKEFHDKVTIEVLYKKKSGRGSCNDRLVEKLVRCSLSSVLLTSLYPRTSIQISIQEIENDGHCFWYIQLLSSCINAAFLACLDASIPMSSHLAAVDIALLKDKNYIAFPSVEQLKDAVATFTVVYESRSHNVVALHTSGVFSVKQLKRVLTKKALSEATRVFQEYRAAVFCKYSSEERRKRMEDEFKKLSTKNETTSALSKLPEQVGGDADVVMEDDNDDDNDN